MELFDEHPLNLVSIHAPRGGINAFRPRRNAHDADAEALAELLECSTPSGLEGMLTPPAPQP